MREHRAKVSCTWAGVTRGASAGFWYGSTSQSCGCRNAAFRRIRGTFNCNSQTRMLCSPRPTPSSKTCCTLPSLSHQVERQHQEQLRRQHMAQRDAELKKAREAAAAGAAEGLDPELAALAAANVPADGTGVAAATAREEDEVRGQLLLGWMCCEEACRCGAVAAGGACCLLLTSWWCSEPCKIRCPSCAYSQAGCCAAAAHQPLHACRPACCAG